MSLGRVLVYGGTGALGSKCISWLKANQYWVISVSHGTNPEADYNITVNRDDDSNKQDVNINQDLQKVIVDEKLKAILCVAGGWAGGNVKQNLVETADLMWKQNVCSSLIATSIATKFLSEDGLVVLTGAKAALEPTGTMIGYGMAKAAVHHLVKSLGSKNNTFPKGSVVTCILPTILDTPANRINIPNGDYSTWTSLDFVSELLLEWVKDKEKRPKHGSLYEIVTKESESLLVAI